MKFHDTPIAAPYLRWLLRHRIAVIAFFFALAAAAALTGRFHFVLSDEQLWLGGSDELARTQSLGITPETVTHLRVYVNTFNDDAKTKLQALDRQLREAGGVQYVDSLFSRTYIYNDIGAGGSSMIRSLPLEQLSAAQMRAFIHAFPVPYGRYVSKGFSHFDFYVYGSGRLDARSLSIPFAYTLENADGELSSLRLWGYLSLILLTTVLLFRLLFRNFISAAAAIIIVTLTLLFTFELVSSVTGLHELHPALGLIIIAIALVDYLYFYYRWHVTQYRADPQRALQRMLERIVIPAVWTTVITAIGLGSLLFSTNDIVRMLSISIIGASLTALLLNTTLLIALLSFFRVRRPHVNFMRPMYAFVGRQLHYNPLVLKLFNLATFAILLAGVTLFLTRADLLLSPGKSGSTLVLSVPFDQIDPATVHKIDRLSAELKNRFPSVERIDSVAQLLHHIHSAEAPGKSLDDQAVLRALFFIDMYDLNRHYFDDAKGTLKLTLFLKPGSDTGALLSYLRHYRALPLYFEDMNSLVHSAKQQQTAVLAASLFAALVIIGIIMGIIFRNPRIIFIGFIANAIPIAWFGLAAQLLRVPVSLEMLVAMSIAVGLGSDAAVHLAFTFFRARYFGRSRKHALELSFFYGAAPVAIGAAVLIIFLASLSFSPVASLQDIGKYGAVLISLSLATDLLLLPVLLLSIDPYPQRRELHDNYCSI
jgi:predicted RND superfamily exporter protein